LKTVGSGKYFLKKAWTVSSLSSAKTTWYQVAIVKFLSIFINHTFFSKLQFISLKIVDLPAPFCHIIVILLPFLTLKLTSSKIGFLKS